jgi:ankyrin repeat protein
VLKDESLFLSPFNEENYYKLMEHPHNCLRLDEMFSANMCLRLKVFAARQKDKKKKMFFDLIIKYPSAVCPDERCMLKPIVLSDDMIMSNKELVSLYKTKWTLNDIGNGHHFNKLLRIIQISCKPYVDLLLAQDIDIMAIDEHGNTVLHETCKKDAYAWATKKLISNGLCNINATNHEDQQTPLHAAVNAGSRANVKILLTCPGIEMRAQNCARITPLLYAFNYYRLTGMNYEIYKLLRAADPFQES